MQTRQVDKATRLSKSETDHVAWWTRERLPQANVEGRLKTHPMAGFPNPTGGASFQRLFELRIGFMGGKL